jgi:hypothetical protein
MPNRLSLAYAEKTGKIINDIVCCFLIHLVITIAYELTASSQTSFRLIKLL